MASGRPHAYHLPSEVEQAHTQLIISHRHDRIQSIDQSIESEKALLDVAVARLEASFAPSIANIKADIQRLIEKEEERVAALIEERSKAEGKLREATAKRIHKLEKERAALDKEIGNDKGFIAPIRRLPSELLSEIFLWFEANSNPWPLTKVCRSWRSVALRTPSLWRSITITDSKSNVKFSYNRPFGYGRFDRKIKTAPSEEQSHEGAQRCKTTKGLETALKLAGNTPLRIVINIGNPDDYSYLGLLDTTAVQKERIEMLDIITKQFSRIQSLIITNLPRLQQTESTHPFTSIFQGKLPILQELEVNTNTRNAFINPLMEAVQSSARSLKSLTYSQPSGMWGNMDVVIDVNLDKSSLARLTSLRIGASAIPFDHTVWESMIHLRELEFSGHIPRDWSAQTLPNLTRLTISGGTATDLGGRLPRLEYLSLDAVVLDAPAFSISAPVLQTFIIHSDHIEVARMFDAPVLESLDMCSKLMKKADANHVIAMIWEDNGAASGRCLNPRKLRIDVDANDLALVKALKQMDKLEDLQLGIRAKMNVRRKVLGDLAAIGKRNGKGIKDGAPAICPNLKRLEVFPGQWTTRDKPLSGPGDKLQLQTLLDSIAAARSGIDCVLKEQEYSDELDAGDMFWAYD